LGMGTGQGERSDWGKDKKLAPCQGKKLLVEESRGGGIPAELESLGRHRKRSRKSREGNSYHKRRSSGAEGDLALEIDIGMILRGNVGGGSGVRHALINAAEVRDIHRGEGEEAWCGIQDEKFIKKIQKKTWKGLNKQVGRECIAEGGRGTPKRFSKRIPRKETTLSRMGSSMKRKKIPVT